MHLAIHREISYLFSHPRYSPILNQPKYQYKETKPFHYFFFFINFAYYFKTTSIGD
ncbi:hypothetical protein NEISICOT_01979 [Neisseria sicca ATCC 29256]|uniref:Uncharacterized protein n=1 Tax=Neisseria sicca ATCC 29256 TaxID=547045 RepID=C6M628_NEISI|nr:hypothetical protein NEISICOT_01979 [Neisseria sicca ATCC 29256]